MTSVAAHDSRADFLQVVPIFAGLPAEMRATIGARASWVRVPAGEWVMRQGEPGDSLYVLRSGRLEILLEQPQEEVLRVLTRGAVVGELALMTGSPRSASVRARRDSELLKLERAHFMPLLTEQPEFSVALARELGHQLQLSRGLPLFAEALPATVAVVPLSPGGSFERFSEELSSQLGRWKRVACLDARGQGLEEPDYADALDRCERDNELVLLLAGAEGADASDSQAWLDFCLRQADRTLALWEPEAGASPLLEDERLHGCDLVSVNRGAPPSGAQAVFDSVDPRTHRPVAAGDGFADGVGAIARRLAGRSVGVVLSGGGARGFAHIGVLDELVSAGLQIDRVGGCSMGAYVGAMFAAGMSAREMIECSRAEFVERNPLNDYTVPTVSLVRGNRAESMIRRTFGARTIEWLPREFFSVACDLISGELVVHRRGPLAEAVGSSMCLPGIFPPVGYEGRLLVDGGVLNNLPVAPMAASAEGPVIASDVSAQFALPVSGRSVASGWLSRRIAVRGAGTTPMPALKETLTRSITIGSVDAVSAAREQADLLIEPQTAGIGMLEFRELDRIVQAGRRAALDALARADEPLFGA
jgi:NTE family protein